MSEFHVKRHRSYAASAVEPGGARYVLFGKQNMLQISKQVNYGQFFSIPRSIVRLLCIRLQTSIHGYSKGSWIKFSQIAAAIFEWELRIAIMSFTTEG